MKLHNSTWTQSSTLTVVHLSGTTKLRNRTSKTTCLVVRRVKSYFQWFLACFTAQIPIAAGYVMRRSYYFIAWFSNHSILLWAEGYRLKMITEDGMSSLYSDFCLLVYYVLDGLYGVHEFNDWLIYFSGWGISAHGR